MVRPPIGEIAMKAVLDGERIMPADAVALFMTDRVSPQEPSFSALN